MVPVYHMTLRRLATDQAADLIGTPTAAGRQSLSAISITACGVDPHWWHLGTRYTQLIGSLIGLPQSLKTSSNCSSNASMIRAEPFAVFWNAQVHCLAPWSSRWQWHVW